MYYSFTGRVTLKGSDFICLEVAGIEWQLIASQYSMAAVKIGEQVKIYGYMQHNESGMALYGFSSLEEKELFLNLIKVSGIGPKGAIKMLGGATPATLLNALEESNISLLAELPGIGKATAQKAVLALKGKLVFLSDDEPSDELVNSLIAMGYDKKKTVKVLAELRRELGDGSSEGVILKAAIVKLSN